MRRGRRGGERGKRLQVGGWAQGEEGWGRGQGSHHSGFWAHQPGAEALSSSRDQRQSVEVLSKGWHAHTHKFAMGYARNVQRGSSRVHLGETSQQVAPQSRTEARDKGSKY